MNRFRTFRPQAIRDHDGDQRRYSCFRIETIP
jgi:hypothetical protein